MYVCGACDDLETVEYDSLLVADLELYHERLHVLALVTLQLNHIPLLNVSYNSAIALNHQTKNNTIVDTCTCVCVNDTHHNTQKCSNRHRHRHTRAP